MGEYGRRQTNRRERSQLGELSTSEVYDGGSPWLLPSFLRQVMCGLYFSSFALCLCLSYVREMEP